eukprot:g216.t1
MAGVCFYERSLTKNLGPSIAAEPNASSTPLWDVICVTSQHKRHADAYATELRQRLRDNNAPPVALILAVSDPGYREGSNNAIGGVGSGGATLNALLVTTEHLSALQGETAITPDALRGRRVLLLHVGGGDRVPCFSELPGGGAGTAVAHGTVEALLACVSPLARASGPGVWVCSAEALAAPTDARMAAAFAAATSTAAAAASAAAGAAKPHGIVTAVSFATPASHVAGRHGCYVLGTAQDCGEGARAAGVRAAAVERVLYRASAADMQAAGATIAGTDAAAPPTAAMVCGLLFFDAEAARHLLFLQPKIPGDACTYHGIDGGAEPAAFSLYLDLLAAATPHWSAAAQAGEGASGTTSDVRRAVHAHAHGKLQLQAVVLPAAAAQGRYDYIRTHAELLDKLAPAPAADQAAPAAVMLNSISEPAPAAAQGLGLGAGAAPPRGGGLLEHCCLPADSARAWTVPPGALLSGVRHALLFAAALQASPLDGGGVTTLPAGACVQQLQVEGEREEAAAAAAAAGSPRPSAPTAAAGPAAAAAAAAAAVAPSPFVVLTTGLTDTLNGSAEDDGCTLVGASLRAAAEVALSADLGEGAGAGAAEVERLLWPDGGPFTLRRARLFPRVLLPTPAPLAVDGEGGTATGAGSDTVDDLRGALLWLGAMQVLASGGGAGSLPAAQKQWLCRARRSWLGAPARLSYDEAIESAALGKEFGWRRDLSHRARAAAAQSVLLRGGGAADPDGGATLRAAFGAVAAVARGNGGRGGAAALKHMLGALDAVAMAPETPPDVAARTLAQIAELLATFTDGHGGLRSGPARNAEWRSAFALLQRAARAAQAGRPRAAVRARASAVRELRRVRERWLVCDGGDGRGGGYAEIVASAGTLVRAARHYEGAAAVLIQEAVATASEFVVAERAPAGALPAGTWARAEAAARIDIAGGWTDTPPISYEHGGAVTNLALLLDGKRPIGARVSVLQEPRLVLQLGGAEMARAASSAELRASHAAVVCDSLRDLEDYCAPSAPAALLKAAVLCAELVRMPTADAGGDGDEDEDGEEVEAGAGGDDVVPPLGQQLAAVLGGSDGAPRGLHIVTWSTLPTGSGLGTSSILAAALLRALGEAAGRPYTDASLVHAVLKLEQMLTTGGGWQDQVGGIYPGAKVGRSLAQLPLEVTVEPIPLATDTVAKLSAHTLLIFTGRPRLARNLLQVVIRRWYARLPEITQTADDLTANAEAAKAAFQSGDLAAIGRCLSLYWTHKKCMAKGCEPGFVTAMMRVLAPHAHGWSLAGAGGGGFLCVITKEPHALEAMRALVEAHPDVDASELGFFTAQVDTEGLQTTTEQC